MRLRSFTWCLGTVLLAAIVSFLVARETSKRVRESGTSAHSEACFHDWLHENLEITTAQENFLAPHERVFEEKRKEIRAKINEAGLELADAIRKFEADSEEVTAVRERLTGYQGELQQATLDHFFAMKEHLTEAQGEKLLQWTRESIIHGHHD